MVRSYAITALVLLVAFLALLIQVLDITEAEIIERLKLLGMLIGIFLLLAGVLIGGIYLLVVHVFGRHREVCPFCTNKTYWTTGTFFENGDSKGDFFRPVTIYRCKSCKRRWYKWKDRKYITLKVHESID
jgi:hypothetical protein